MNARTRGFVLFGCKAALATALLTWLIRSNALDFGALAIFVQKPWLLVADAVYFALAILLSCLRWRVLLTLAGVHLPFGRALQLQTTALFFNVVIPGSVGGDVIKGLYAAREATPEKRPTVLLIVFVERLLGLGGLVVVAGAVTILRGPTLWQNPQLGQLAMAVGVLAILTLIGPVVFVLVLRRLGPRLDRVLGGPSRIAKILTQLVAAVTLLASGPKKLAITLGLSMAMHTLAMTLFMLLARGITEQDVSYSAVATVFPLGILTLVAPIAPAGMGVGHVAFDRLFAIIGLHGGATVFNVFLFGQITPSLLGVFPYLALRRSGSLPDASEATASPPA